MDAGITVDAQPKAVFRNFVEDTVAELDNVFLEGLVAGGIIEHFSDDPGIAGPQDIVLGNSH
jgi:hypothetical protein